VKIHTEFANSINWMQRKSLSLLWVEATGASASP